MDELEKEAEEEANVRKQTRENRSPRDAAGDTLPQASDDGLRPGQSIYGSLKSAKKRKREHGES